MPISFSLSGYGESAPNYNLYQNISRYLISLQYGIFHISFLQSQARGHNAEDIVMSSIQLGPLSFTLFFQFLLKKKR